ncbi:hypothetical protein ACFSTA_04380 [Ornithinibacillus salinisoli]|uniref:DUF4179 domain-containing protein n=1 Tax=Ornithinibacillus salinisoli TaxID=1848459 RepID=A0ABW4VVF9_9BACI
MDKQLKHLKSHYENEVPTTFTEKDKQAVLEKIKQTDKRTSGKVFPFYPKVLTGVVLAALVIIVVISTNNQPDMFMSLTDDAADSEMDSNEMAEMREFSDGGDSSLEEEGEAAKSQSDMEIAGDAGNHFFDPETVLIGSTYGSMEVIEVDRQSEQTSIIFNGETSLSGDFQLDGDRLAFVPHENALLAFPLANGDERNIPAFYFQDESSVKMAYGIGDDQNSLSTADQGYTLDVTGMEYIHSPTGSTIYLEITTRMTNTYDTNIKMSQELTDIYEQYKETLNDELLEGLNPIDVFKMHFYAENNEDEEVKYALYIQDEMYGTPDKDAYFNDPFFAEDDTMKKNAEQFYEELLAVDVFKEEYLSEEEAIIHFATVESNGLAFRLIKNSEDIWKVAWIPMQ